MKTASIVLLSLWSLNLNAQEPCPSQQPAACLLPPAAVVSVEPLAGPQPSCKILRHRIQDLKKRYSEILELVSHGRIGPHRQKELDRALKRIKSFHAELAENRVVLTVTWDITAETPDLAESLQHYLGLEIWAPSLYWSSPEGDLPNELQLLRAQDRLELKIPINLSDYCFSNKEIRLLLFNAAEPRDHREYTAQW